MVREGRGNGTGEGEGAAPRATLDVARWGRMHGARVAWRAAILAGRSLRVHGAVA